MIGYPSGLPAKIIHDDATSVREHYSADHPQFLTNLDAFAGASGSAVFRNANQELVGLLSSGEDDYEPSLSDCKRPRRCTDDGCMGERVIRASVLARTLKQATFKSTTPPLTAESTEEFKLPVPNSNVTRIELPIKEDVTVGRVSLVFSVRHAAVTKLKATLTHPDGKTSVGQVGLDSNNIWSWATMYRMSKFLGLPTKGVWTLTVEEPSGIGAEPGGVVSDISLTIN